VAEGVRGVSEDPRALITEATTVLRDCDRLLRVAAELVDGIPARREEAQKRVDAARKRLSEAEEKWRRVVYDDNSSREEEREADREYERAQRSVYSTYPLYRPDDLDPENRKAVARQLAGLVREESWQRLNNIAARSEDPEVQRTVARCKDEVSQTIYRLIKRFKEASPLEPDELRTTRAEAYAILDRLRSPPA
jgi:hypothetical protein